MMIDTFNCYQVNAARTIPDTMSKEDILLNGVLGVTGEAGEIADMQKKILFQGHLPNKEKLLEEVGDCLWYLACICTALGVDMNTVAEKNIEKLWKRYPDGFSEEASRNRIK